MPRKPELCIRPDGHNGRCRPESYREVRVRAQRKYHATHREAENARCREYHAEHSHEVHPRKRVYMRDYRGTAAGILATTRSEAKRRGNRTQ